MRVCNIFFFTNKLHAYAFLLFLLYSFIVVFCCVLNASQRIDHTCRATNHCDQCAILLQLCACHHRETGSPRRRVGFGLGLNSASNGPNCVYTALLGD